jgi:hypothetical protein
MIAGYRCPPSFTLLSALAEFTQGPRVLSVMKTKTPGGCRAKCLAEVAALFSGLFLL